jgi:hypothetical protein
MLLVYGVVRVVHVLLRTVLAAHLVYVVTH